MCLSPTGDKVALTSNRGTEIRVFSTQTGNQLATYSRGTMNAVITSLSFCPQGLNLLLASNTGTIHVFSPEGALTWTGMFATPLLGSPSTPASRTHLCSAEVKSNDAPRSAFVGSSSNTFAVISQSGIFHKFTFDTVCKEEEKFQFYSQGRCSEFN